MRTYVWMALCFVFTAIAYGRVWSRECQTGPGVRACVHCKDLDLDHDGDVDQTDYGLWQRTDGKAILVFVVDLSIASMNDPVEYVRQELNRRHK